jgi:hypothetical protein
MKIQQDPVISYLATRDFDELIWVWPNWRAFGSQSPPDPDFGQRGLRRWGLVQSPVTGEPILFHVDVQMESESTGWKLWSRDRSADKFRLVAHCDCESPSVAIKDFENWVLGLKDPSVFGSWLIF